MALNLNLGDAQRAHLLEFLSQMQRWNKTYNLTALRDPEQMLIQHVFDSLSVVTPFARALDTVANPLIVDVGSGGGLPGIALAIARPDWEICCIDAVEKKIAFIRQMAAVLCLSNLRACHGRVEALEAMSANLVVSRAFASLSDFVAMAGHHAKNGASLAAMKGREPLAEIQTMHAEHQWQVREVQNLHVPELSAQRCLVWISRQDKQDSSTKTDQLNRSFEGLF